MSKCKTKATQTDLDIFRHNHAYPGIIQAYSKPYVTLAYNRYNYFHKLELFLQYKPVAFSASWNKYREVVTPAVVYSM